VIIALAFQKTILTCDYLLRWMTINYFKMTFQPALKKILLRVYTIGWLPELPSLTIGSKELFAEGKHRH
jgi:hypothetical protein